MKGLHLKGCCAAVLLYLVILWWYYKNDSHYLKHLRPLPQNKTTPHPIDPCKVPSKPDKPPLPEDLCKDCNTPSLPLLKEILETIRTNYSCWKKQEDSCEKFRSQLIDACHGFDKAIVTQAITSVGSKLKYDGEKKKTFQVSKEFFETFPKEHPFSSKPWDTCAVVGNGGILSNSSCGKKIDSAQVVIRCNLPPVGKSYENDVGAKTDLVTANPSILIDKFDSLMGRRRSFVEALESYGNSILMLPAFSYSHNTHVCQRAVYSIEEFKSPIRPVFFNPDYLQSLFAFWRSQGLKPQRLSTGLIMVSLALELCDNVYLYGFWPFNKHPERFHDLTNHYYDDVPAKTKFHAMPEEFKRLLQLHSEGVLRLHLGDCQGGEKYHWSS